MQWALQRNVVDFRFVKIAEATISSGRREVCRFTELACGSWQSRYVFFVVALR